MWQRLRMTMRSRRKLGHSRSAKKKQFNRSGTGYQEQQLKSTCHCALSVPLIPRKPRKPSYIH
jgi:hypothetical protein